MTEFMFSSTSEETKAKEFIENHNKKCKLPQTAIGGSWTYEFTPTSIGVIIKVKHCCGTEFDVTDYEDW